MAVKNKENTTREDKLNWDDYLLAEEDMRSPGVHHLTVFSEGIRSLADIPDIEAFLDRLLEKIKSSAWSRKKGSRYREGFLNIDLDKRNNTLSCVYSKESAQKIRQEKNLRIVENTIRAITSSHKVEIELIFADNRTLSIAFYGGEEMFMMKAKNDFFKHVKVPLPSGFSLIPGGFDPDSMRQILNQFGEDVEEIGLAPGNSEKLKRFAEEHRELLYEAHVKAHGYRIRMAPVVRQLLEDEEIKIKGIKGYMVYGGIKIKTVITSSGRVHFYFPSSYFDDQSIYEAANRLYRKLRQQPLKAIEQTIIDSFGEVILETQGVEYAS